MSLDKDLYLFDFDGTLTKVDTLFDFLKFSFSNNYKLKYFLFIPLFVLAKLKLQNTELVKKKFIHSFLKNKSRSELKILSETYFKLRGKDILRNTALEYIYKIDDMHDKYIVSASLDIWIEPFANHVNAKMICTKSEFDLDQIFTGNFSTPNCNYDEKKKRIEREIDLSIYKNIFTFGDTKGDEAMFSLATQSFFRKFH